MIKAGDTVTIIPTNTGLPLPPQSVVRVEMLNAAK